MFVACGIWCLADVSSVSPSSEQTCSVEAVVCSDEGLAAVCSDEGLTLETSAKHHIPQATNIPYQTCSSVGRATVICPRDHALESHSGQRFFFFLHVGPFPF